MKMLALYDLEEIDEFARPNSVEKITLNSSALEVFTDFTVAKPLILESSVSAVNAELLMQKAHVRLKFVVDENNHFMGIVSKNGLNDREVIKKVHAGETRDDLMVTDFMHARNTLKALDFKSVENAVIGDIVETLKENGLQHCLVLDRDKHQIRGIISASDIIRKLHLPVDIMNNSSFVDIFNAIA